MDKFKLEYEMRKNGVGDQEMAKRLNLSRSAFYRKKNGKTEFTLAEIKGIISILGLSSPMEIFFAEMVS